MYVKPIQKPYTYKSIVDTYIYTQCSFHHEDFSNYYSDLFKVLETAFETAFDRTQLNFEQNVFWMLFQQIVSSLVNDLQTSVLEAGLIYIKLESKGDLGKNILANLKHLGSLSDEKRQTQRELLYQIYQCMFGVDDKSLSSSDLRGLGLDDRQEPLWQNYLDSL